MRKLLRFCKKLFLRSIYWVTYKGLTQNARVPITNLPLGKFFRLDIPTYDGSGQAVHPSLLVQSDNPRFILAFTPYTDTDDRVENPSIVVSDDGLHFHEEVQGLNPLAAAPEKDHNDDPDLFLYNGKYGILYLETMRPEKQTLYLLESQDRIHWKRRAIHQENLAACGECFMLSPTYIEKDGVSYLFYVNRDAKDGYLIEYVTGSGLDSLDFENRKRVTVNGLKELPWHLDILKDDGGYIMLLTTASDAGKNARYTLRKAASSNLLDWTLDNNFRLADCYRSSGFIKDNMLYLYVSKIFCSRWHRKKWNILLYKAEK